MQERAFQQKVKKTFESHGCLVVKCDADSCNGFPDLTVMGQDTGTFFIEVKTPSGRLSKIQKCTHLLMKRHGATIYVVNALEQIEEILIAQRLN